MYRPIHIVRIDDRTNDIFILQATIFSFQSIAMEKQNFHESAQL
ncbi:DUF6888 family protein [Phormidesmis priestleyi ANT.L61.2]